VHPSSELSLCFESALIQNTEETKENQIEPNIKEELTLTPRALGVPSAGLRISEGSEVASQRITKRTGRGWSYRQICKGGCPYHARQGHNNTRKSLIY
jgi:hypothetical protein